MGGNQLELRPVYTTDSFSMSITISMKFTLCVWWQSEWVPYPFSPSDGLSTDTMINFDGDGDGHRDRDGTCK